MGTQVKQQGNEWVVKLTLVSLCIILLAGLGAGGYVGYLYYQLYYEHDAEALVELYRYGFRDFRGVNLRIRSGRQIYSSRQIHLEGANLQDASLRDSWLISSNLRNTNLQNTDLEDVFFMSSDLQNANLKNANLQNANLYNVNLQEAHFQGVNLQGASLGDTKNLTAKQISQCKNIQGVRDLSKEFLMELKQLNPELVKWWNENMVKEIQEVSEDTDEEYWTGRWIEPPTNQADKQGER